jgi:hypothetical protein
MLLFKQAKEQNLGLWSLGQWQDPAEFRKINKILPKA